MTLSDCSRCAPLRGSTEPPSRSLSSRLTAYIAAGLILGGANGVYAKPARSVAQPRKAKTCSVLGQLSGLEGYEIPGFVSRCEKLTIGARPEVPTDPATADFLVANDPLLATNAYRLLGMYKLAKDLGLSHTSLAQQSIWYASLRKKCTSKDCLRAAYHDRLGALTAALEMASDPMPLDWNGTREAAGCPNDRTDSFQLTYEIKRQEVRGEVLGSVHCTSKVFDINLRGTISAHLAFVTYEAGWGDERQTAEAVIASRSGHVYWEVLSPMEVEDYVWDSADTTGQ